MGSHKQLDRIERMLGRTLTKVDSLENRVTALEQKRIRPAGFPAPNISDPSVPAADPLTALLDALQRLAGDDGHVLRHCGRHVALDRTEVYGIADELGIGHKDALELLHRAGVLMPSGEDTFHYARKVRVPPDGEPARAIVIRIEGL